MQNILSLKVFKQQLEEHERVALLMFNPEDETSRRAFRTLAEAIYLGDNQPVFVVDINEVIDIQSYYQITEIPSLVFFVKGKLVEIVKGGQESDFVKALISHQLAHSEK